MKGRDPPVRQTVAQAYIWASRASQLATQSAVPPLLGYWADSSWGTKPWMIILGAVVGFSLLMLGVMELAAVKPKPPRQSRADRPSE